MGPEELEADAANRAARLAQLSAAYQLSAGQRIAHAIASQQDAIERMRASLRHGESARNAIAAQAAPWDRAAVRDALVPALLRAVSSSGSRMRLRKRKSPSEDGGRAALDMLILRAVVEGSSSRAISESTARVSMEPKALDALSAILLRSLVGSYSACLCRPSLRTRSRLEAMSGEDLARIVRELPIDAPLVSASLVEAAAELVDSALVHGFSALWPGTQSQWEQRVARARQFMDTVRGALDTEWGAGINIIQTLQANNLASTMRRVYRRLTCPAPKRLPKKAPAALDEVVLPQYEDADVLTILTCEGCGAVKNFVFRAACAPLARAACGAGFLGIAAPNLLEDDAKPICTTKKAACENRQLARAQLRRAPGTGTFGDAMVLAGGAAVTTAPCCGILCSMRVLQTTQQGAWACPMCRSKL